MRTSIRLEMMPQIKWPNKKIQVTPTAHLIWALELIRIMMKKLHIAISTNKINETINDYTIRLGVEPYPFISNEYALWRTDSLNVSICQDFSCTHGDL